MKENAMNILILFASPRPNGNTAQLVGPFAEELAAIGHSAKIVSLYDLQIEPCYACRRCQKDYSTFGCRHNDDVQAIFDKVLAADLVVLATPIYSWYCTPPMKALLDRLVYGMNKYYGDEAGPSLWEGKALALLTTCGYPPEKGADLWESGMRRYCKHSRLRYLGMLCERHRNYSIAFMDEEKASRARDFARTLLCKAVESR